MTDLSIGVILLVVGMLGTLGSLGLLSLMIVLLKRLFPYGKEGA
ncbi:MAG TPA: OadG-related small transporter subunit [Methylomirabilota bacterium]|jgi:hypothetical protein|nr:OadG-related small transporter subunit [Methylomirabilota bacterium]